MIKEDAASPTVATKSLFITTAEDKREGLCGATFDIPGSYLHTETDEQVIIFLVEALADIMVKVYPKIYESMSSLVARGNRFYVSKYKRRCMVYYG